MEGKEFINVLPIGRILQGKYIIKGVLGQGGFGITYDVEIYKESGHVAIKEYFPMDLSARDGQSNEIRSFSGQKEDFFKQGMARFKKEADTLAKFQNVPSIVHIRSRFEENGTSYFVMEKIDGISLKEYVLKKEDKRLAWEEAVGMLMPIIDALGIVHSSGIIHRDIAPDNILVDHNGRAILIDFGAAAIDTKGKSRSLDVILKQGFAPYEQYTSHGKQSVYTDVYAMAATLYFCLTGQVPMDSIERLQEDTLPSPRKLGASLTEGQEHALLKGMAVQPEDRYQSMQEFGDALRSGRFPFPYLVPKAAVVLFSVLALGVLAFLGTRLSRSGEAMEDVKEKDSGTELSEMAAEPDDADGAVSSDLTDNGVGEQEGAEGDALPVLESEGESSGDAVAAEDSAVAEKNVLMADTVEYDESVDESQFPAFGSEIRRNEVVSISFLDSTKDVPEEHWDVSQAGDGSVLAWAVPDGNGLYELFIAGEGGVYAPEDCSSLLANYSNAERISFGDAFHTDHVENMWCMFYHCDQLRELDVSGFQTGNVEMMAYMFSDCGELQELVLGDMDTRNVANMANMFYNCGKLEGLDVSGMEIGKLKSTRAMFSSCRSLKELDVSGFGTGNVTDMGYMFYGCSGLGALDVSNFETGNVTDMGYMFYGCSGLKALDVSHFKTGKVTNMGYMFYECSGLGELKVDGMDTRNVTSMSHMFFNCSSLKELDIHGLDTRNTTSLLNMFKNCSGLRELDVSGLDTRKVQNMSGLFQGCSGLSSLTVGGGSFDTAKVEDMSHMFRDCSGLKELDLSGFDTGNVKDMSCMFWECSGLKTLDLSSFDTRNVADMVSIFVNCASLTELDLSGFDTSKVENMAYMFFGCSRLPALEVSGFRTGNAKTMEGMFEGCSALEGTLDLRHFDTRNVTDVTDMFKKCSSLSRLDLSSFDLSQVPEENRAGMFEECSAEIIGL